MGTGLFHITLRLGQSPAGSFVIALRQQVFGYLVKEVASRISWSFGVLLPKTGNEAGDMRSGH